VHIVDDKCIDLNIFTIVQIETCIKVYAGAFYSVFTFVGFLTAFVFTLNSCLISQNILLLCPCKNIEHIYDITNWLKSSVCILANLSVFIFLNLVLLMDAVMYNFLNELLT